MFTPATMAALASIGAVLLGLIAVGVFAQDVSERDLSRHIQHVLSGQESRRAPRTVRAVVLSLLRRLGTMLQRLSVFSARDLAELERAARSAGFAPESTVPVLIGSKFVLMLSLPAVAYLLTSGFSSPWPIICTGAGVVAGIFGPNMLIDSARRARLKSLRLGLGDALDLLVVCAEAGLGLESAIDRVSAELALSSPSVAGEFAALGQDLRLSSDRSAALLRMGERTGLDSFQRLTMTLAQTLRFGTPLGQALRILAAEMRTDRLIRLEEKAAKLPTLMMIPLAIFILPCLFIVVAGPAGMRLMAVLG